MDVLQISPVLVGAIPVVVGVVEMVKGLGMPSKFAPLSSVVLGIGISFLVGGPVLTVVLGGLIVGLTASGLYSGGKATFTG